MRVPLRRWLYHGACRSLVLAHRVALRAAAGLGPRGPRAPGPGGVTLLLTGTFHSENWIRAHLRPLAAARRCREVTMVTTTNLGDLAGVRAVHPPRWLVRVVGQAASRCLVLLWVAAREKPDLVGGFHLLVNGLAAQVAARLSGARSVYFCVAGADEAAGGGYRAENPVFGRMETPDRFVEGHLLRAVAAFDLLVTMGTGAAEYFRRHGFGGECHVIPGGVEGGRSEPSGGPSPTDIVVVGRLAEVKRLDVFLDALARVRVRLPWVTATLVGDGPERRRLEESARRLRVDDRVRFAGFHRDVRPWLAAARLSVLSSDSEGLPLALLEAMMAGLPVVATDVGDIRDLVEDGVSGFLVPRRDPSALAERILAVLEDDSRRAELGRRARAAALRYETRNVTAAWDGILARFGVAEEPVRLHAS